MSDKIREVPFRRGYQPAVVRMLEELLESARRGEVTGVLAIWVDDHGHWHHQRDLDNSDTPNAIAHLDMFRLQLGYKYLTGEPLAEELVTPDDC